MGHRCCSKQKVKRGLWSPEEDEKLIRYITAHGHGSWSSVPKLAGLQRCGKSCRLRWINYLRPELKRGSFTAQEEQIIIDVHRILGNRWAQIAKHLPGRTDNEVKNFWNSCIKKKLISQGLDPKTHNLISSSHQRQLRNSTNTTTTTTTANTTTTTLPQTTTTHDQQPFSLFFSTTTVNNQQTDDDASNSMEYYYLLNRLLPRPPFVTVPSSSLNPPTSQQPSLHLPTSHQHENPNPLIWTPKDDQCSLIGSALPIISSPPPPPPLNPQFGFGFSDSNSNSNSNSMWNAHAHAHVEPLEGPTPEQQVQCFQEMNNISETGINTIDHEQKCGHDNNIDVSFDSSCFDLELVESALLSGAISQDDLAAWNF